AAACTAVLAHSCCGTPVSGATGDQPGCRAGGVARHTRSVAPPSVIEGSYWTAAELLRLFSSADEGAFSPHLGLGDRPAVDRVWAVNNTQDARPGVEVGQWRVVADTRRAEHFDGAVDDLRRHLRDGDFDRGDLGTCRARAVTVDEPGCLVYEQAGLFDID